LDQAVLPLDDVPGRLGQKDIGQARILAVDITHAGFAWCLKHGCPSHPDAGITHETWRALMERSPVRIQWDPDRDFLHRPLPHRAIQIGLSGLAVQLYVSEWIVAITDITEVAQRMHALVLAGALDQAAQLLPNEQPYEVRSSGAPAA
jgi:hypothetical protein